MSDAPRHPLRPIGPYRQERGLSPIRVHLRKPFSLLAQHWFGWQVRSRLWAMAGVRIDTAYVGRECFFDQEVPELITVENEVTISTRVTLVAHDTQRGVVGPVIIRRRAFLGAGSIILPGVEVGEDAVVGAGAVVTKSVPPGITVVGNPARPLRREADSAE